MLEEDLKQERDDARCETALQTIKDVLWRFDEASEGTRSVYDIVGYLLEDMVNEGFCPACLNEMLTQTFTSTGADPTNHIDDAGSVYH